MILVTGITGQLGYDVAEELKRRGEEFYAPKRDELPLGEGKADELFSRVKPDAVIHCAAYTQVDKAEDEKELCEKVNALGTEEIARACKKIGAKLIYISTDYVFLGDGESFYAPNDEKAPQNVYGASKLKGEEAVQNALNEYFIVRISWVFGINGNNFIKTMLRLGKERDKLTVVDDQIGSPTYTHDLAPLLCDMAKSERYGVYHATNEGVCSWADLAIETFRLANMNVEVARVDTGAYPTKAVRPKNSRLDKSDLDKAGFSRLPKWQDAVARYLGELKTAGKFA